MSKLLQLALFVFVSVSAICAQQPAAHNPVIRGDRPDPSVIRVGNTYWATTTSGSWEPGFPIFKSSDLLNWQLAGAVFQSTPAWMVGDFWAPEISTHGNRFFVYYTGRRTDGHLCVAVASAPTPSGPYTDHGDLVCENYGSIDALAVTEDGTGARYLVWKTDGNSQCPTGEKPNGKCEPTPILAQKLSDDGLNLVPGKPAELITNDQPWEAHVVEGAFILRRRGWYYLFYSGNACCGRTCNYALGVARSKRLLGRYDKNPANPILKENATWKCPGHGSIVTDSRGRDFLLYHAYRNSTTGFFIGRQGLLDQVSWGADDWPRINDGRGPSLVNDRPTDSLSDDFDGSNLKPTWQWPNFQPPSKTIDRDGWLMLSPTSDQPGDKLAAVVAQPVTNGNFTATTLIDTSLLKSSVAGISVYQHRGKAVGITVGLTGESHTVSVYKRSDRKEEIVSSDKTGKSSRIHLRVTVIDGVEFHFAFSEDGQDWKKLPKEIRVCDIEEARIALTVGGEREGVAKFDWLRVTSNSAP